MLNDTLPLNETLRVNSTLNGTVSTDDQFTFDPALFPPPSYSETIASLLITTAIFSAISLQAYVHISRGGKGSAFRTVLCLWCVAIRWSAIAWRSDQRGCMQAA